MDMTELQSALINAGMTSLPFNVSGKAYTTDIERLPDATIMRVLTYGKRMMNDYVNSAKATSDTPVDELSAGWIERAKAGTLGIGGTRAASDPYQKALREVVVDYLRASGIKANEARSMAKEPKLAFKGLLVDKLAMAQNIAPQAVTDDQLATAFAANWNKVESAAHAIVDASTGLSIEL